jgi:phospholipid-binding lipoprotein MlaA
VKRLPRGHGPGRAALAALALVVLAGCATVPPSGAKPATDPFESWNRKVFAFNDKVDTAVLKPVAETYRDVVPSFVRTSINNVLGNIYDVWSTANHFLQGKFQSGLEMGMRVLTNTVFGAVGIFDVATEAGLQRRSEDLGQTLGMWGVPSGPYIVLPFLGPSTARDGVGLFIDRQVGPSTLPNANADRYAVTALELLNTRTNLLQTGSLVDQVALDRYSFIRDAYLSRRRDALYDGAPPMETFDDDEGPSPPAAAASAAPAASAAATAASAASAAAK